MTAEQRRGWLSAALLALLAYVPALASSPGRMAADSKLYLYLDPGRLLGDAATTFDPRQFAGWVPHQHIAYLWPTGPWFWLFDTLGVPDWVAHRLWLGTLFVAAGLGVRWCARLLGLGPTAALAAALVYQLSPYVLPYVSRTSVMLLPWAGLGWIVGLTVRATRRADAPSRLLRWADPAALALVVLTVGAVNATALAMIVPAPVLWLVHTVWLGETRWKPAVGAAARTALLALAVSLWWMVMLVIQGRHGADVLPYSESLADVSFTATAPEVWRSLGYWLFYVRDRFAPTTTAAEPYLTSSLGILVSFALPVLALVAVSAVRWRQRRFAALLLAAGLILAVGVHPIDDRSPLLRAVTGSGDEGLALALRSSTRAVPVAVLGIALALGAGIEALRGASLPRVRLPGSRILGADTLAGVLVGLLALANLPALWQAELVDPALERDQTPPAAWESAAAALDDAGARVLQLPGLEFGAFRWGYTVDQPLAAMADSPLVTRDLLPLGSAAAMDLLFALDDRIQDGVAEPSSIATVARLLGASSLWLTNDAAYDRFDVTAPGVVREWLTAAPGVGDPVGYGPLTSNRPVVEMADGRSLGSTAATDPAPPVELYPVEGGPQVTRVAAGTLVVSGSGDGIVDAAAAGLLPDDLALVYSAATPADELADTLTTSAGLLVTDSNRARARHWRSSQDATGFTESAERDGAAPTSLTEPAVGDARLPVFGADDDSAAEPADPDTQTTAEQRGPVIARANAYGQPFALLPEHRPFMAVDGDPTTAWIVGEHADPVGAVLDLTLTDPSTLPTAVRTEQYSGLVPQREITALSVRAYDTAGNELGAPLRVTEEPNAQPSPFDQIALDLPVGTVRITVTIDAVGGGIPGTAGAVAGVGFATVDLGLGATDEVVRPPSDALAAVTAETPLTLAFTRLRVDPADRWRDDPEPALVREFELPDARTFTVTPTVRLDQRASDQELAGMFAWPAWATSRLAGRPEHAGVAAIDGDPATSWITAFDDGGGMLVIDGITEPIDELTVHQPVSGYTTATQLELTALDGQTRTVDLVPDAAGAARAVVDPPLPPGHLTIAISGTGPATTIDRRFGDRFELPTAITEIELAGLPALPDYRDPAALTECIPLVTVGDATLSYALGVQAADGFPAWLGSTDLVTMGCGDTAGQPLALPAGTHLVRSAVNDVPVQLDRLVLSQPFNAVPEQPTVAVTERSARERSIAVTGCFSGCWVVLGEGYNEAWSASVAGSDLGPPTLLDGGFTGWWVDTDRAGLGSFELHAEWTAQRPLTLAYAATVVAVLACLAILVAARRVVRAAEGSDPGPSARASARDMRGLTPASPRALLGVGVVWVVAAGLLAGWWGALVALGGTVVMLILRDRRVPELTAAATVLVLAGAVVLRARRLAPPPDGGWPHVFEDYHRFGMFAIAAVVAAALCADDAKPGSAGPGSVPSAP